MQKDISKENLAEEMITEEANVARVELNLEELEDVDGGLNFVQGAAATAALVAGVTFAGVPAQSHAAQVSNNTVRVETTMNNTHVNQKSAQSAAQIADRKAAALDAKTNGSTHKFDVRTVTGKSVKVISGVNVRTKPWVDPENKSSVVKGEAQAGHTYELTGIVIKNGKDADWYQIKYGGHLYYISKSFSGSKIVSSKNATTKSTVNQNTTKKTTNTVKAVNNKSDKTPIGKVYVDGCQNYLGIRSAQTTDSDYEIGRANNGETIEVIQKTNDTYWLVRKGNTEGYALAQFLHSFKNKGQQTTQKTQTPLGRKKVHSVSNYLAIRSQPNTTDEKYEIGKAHNGDVVEVLEKTNSTFWKIRKGTVVGYVMAKYVKSN